MSHVASGNSKCHLIKEKLPGMKINLKVFIYLGYLHSIVISFTGVIVFIIKNIFWYGFQSSSFRKSRQSRTVSRRF